MFISKLNLTLICDILAMIYCDVIDEMTRNYTRKRKYKFRGNYSSFVKTKRNVVLTTEQRVNPGGIMLKLLRSVRLSSVGLTS